MNDVSVHEQVGGDPFFFELVDRFYDGVETDPTLRPMYPDDLEPGKQALAWFLIQYWGGSSTYSDARGHPRLRMRHVGFVIDDAARDAWLRHMLAAVEVSEAPPEVASKLRDYFVMAADHMINTG